jgi:hypothetical protein
MSADATFANRAAARLNKILDEQGSPFDALGRATVVSESLKVPVQVAQQILSGRVPWSWEQLKAVSEGFARSPGYFLDPEYGGALPSDAQVVTSADGGESIVWRTPRGFLQRPIPESSALRYLTEHVGIAAFPQGSILIYAESAFAPSMVFAGLHYVIAGRSGLQVMRCTTSRDALATFENEREPGVAIVIPFTDAPADESARIAGIVIAAIAPAA